MSQLGPTYADIYQNTVLLLREFDGDDASSDPITLRKFILQATDEMARRSECFWYALTLPAVDGQSQYCAPGMYKLLTFCYTDITGYQFPLRPVRTQDADRRFPGWRNNSTPNTTPLWAIIEGMNQFRLYPTPTVPVGYTASVLIEGIFVPSLATQSDGVTPLFSGGSDPWPLPDFAVEAVAYRIAMYRAVQFPKDAEKQARAALAKDEYERILQDLIGSAVNYRPPHKYATSYVWPGGN